MESTQHTKDSSEKATHIHQALAEHSAAALATVGDDGLPHLSAVYYQVDDSFVMRFATKKETQKHQNLQRSSHVQLLVFDELQQLTIQISGEAQQIDDSAEHDEIVDTIHRIASDNDFNSPPISKLEAGDFVSYRVQPKRIQMAFFLRPQSGGYDMFETIEFHS